MSIVNPKTAEDFYELLRRLDGSRPADEATIAQSELRSWAVLLSTGRSEIDRAFRQAFPDLSDALIDEWEQTYRLANDSARSLAERQARLRAHELTQKGAQRTALQDTLDATGAIANFVANRRDEVAFAGSEQEAIFQSTLQLGAGDFYDPLFREAVENLYANALPGKNIGQLTRPGRDKSTIVEIGAEWNSADNIIGRDAIGRQVETQRAEFQPPSRIVSFAPGTRVDAEDLNRVQESCVGGPLTAQEDLLDYSAVPAGLACWWFGVDLPVAGTEVVIDSQIDWRDRLIFGVVTYSPNRARLIVPSQANDDEYGGSNITQFNYQISLYTGTGSTGPGVYRGASAAGAGIELFSDTFGDLRMRANLDPSNAVGCLFVTPQLGKRP
jgi:hypothetical protein